MLRREALWVVRGMLPPGGGRTVTLVTLYGCEGGKTVKRVGA